MDAAGLAYQRADNCFIALADPARAQALADSQHQTPWLELLNGLLASAHPLRQEILQPFPNLFYYWTVTQSEYATDLLTRHEGVCIKHLAGFNGQKAYDKFRTLLRVENTLNRPEAFKVFGTQSAPAAPAPLPPSPRAHSATPLQSLPADSRLRANTCVPEPEPQRAWQPLRPTVMDLPRRAEVSRTANKRYRDALASTQAAVPLGRMAAPLCRPITQQGRRYRALQPLGSDAPLLSALSRGEWTIAGVRNRDLQDLLYPGPPRDKTAARRRSASVGRKLRLLRAHGLIRKLPHTHRYLVTETGRTVLTALVAVQNANTQKLTLALVA
jgi:hypothetical protein